MTKPCGTRVESLINEMKRRRLDAFFVTSEINVSYLSGFRGSDSMLLVTRKRPFFITDSRYIEEAQGTVRGFEIELVRDSTYKTLKRLVSRNRLSRIGFESVNLSYEVAVTLKKILPRAKLVPVKGLTENLRALKDPAEIDLIKKSVALSKKVLDNIRSRIKPGVTEAYLSRLVETEFIKNGARPGFDPIIASGRHTSKPHARARDVRIAKNTLVMIDIGANLNCYNSDLTRMIAVGKIGAKLTNVYDIVHAAQEKALSIIKPGVRISDVDHAARNFIQRNGFGKYFGHALGHGVGMEVHEEPRISGSNNGELRPGMVFTVEPAIYIPGLGGVRVEDMVLVTKNSCEILTR